MMLNAMLGAMPGALLNPMLRAMPGGQCTDGRTDGQNGEPPHLRDHLPLSNACETGGEISHRSAQKWAVVA